MKTFSNFRAVSNQIKSYKTPEELAHKHGISVASIEKQLKIGIFIEHEHTKNPHLAMIIASQHLEEFPDYYTRLTTMEKVAKKSEKKDKNISENYTRIQTRGNTYTIILNWKGSVKKIQIFFPNFIRPTKADVTFEVNKVYPGAVVLTYQPSEKDPTKPYFISGDYDAKSR